jgi:hypothetical protein
MPPQIRLKEDYSGTDERRGSKTYFPPLYTTNLASESWKRRNLLEKELGKSGSTNL